MPETMFQRNLLKDEHIEPLAESVLTVLEKVGMLYQNEEMLKALETAGAKVDYSSQMATFPRKMVAEFIHMLNKEAPKEEDSGHREFNAPGLPSLGLQVAQFFYDYEKGEKRSGNKEDFITLIKLGDVLHPENGVGHSLLLTDVPAIIEPLEAGMLLAEYAHKSIGAYVTDVRQMDYLIEMDEILEGESSVRPCSVICFAHPLRFDKDVVDRYVRQVKESGHTYLVPMPVAGVTTPVTTEGFIVVAAAEIIGGWIAARALNPDVQIGSSMWAGTPDMRGGISYSSFDAMFNGFAVSEFMRRWCGKFVPVGGGEYCDAKEPGLYAALEKAYKSMVIAAFQGHHPDIGQGMLECGKTLCPAQLLLERDLGVGVNHFGKSIEPTDDNISLSTILDVGIGLEKSHLEAEHTLRHFSSSLWLPELIDRSGWNGSGKEEELLRTSQARVNELIAQYRKPEVDEEKLARMREVVERARKELLK
ncbi:trimethylamine methyltransferase family protein [Candidatus Poribacteria bacterium]